MIEVENTDVNIPMRNHMPASAYGLKAISDWLNKKVASRLISNSNIRVNHISNVTFVKNHFKKHKILRYIWT